LSRYRLVPLAIIFHALAKGYPNIPEEIAGIDMLFWPNSDALTKA
jgi:hypothetical protein